MTPWVLAVKYAMAKAGAPPTMARIAACSHALTTKRQAPYRADSSAGVEVVLDEVDWIALQDRRQLAGQGAVILDLRRAKHLRDNEDLAHLRSLKHAAGEDANSARSR